VHYAAAAGCAEVVRLLLHKRAILAAVANVLGMTPLYIAAEAGHLEVAQVLLAAGAYVDAQTRLRRTPLYAAAAAGHYGVVQLLLGARASIDAAVTQGSNPLYAAAAAGHCEVVQLLLAHGDSKARQSRIPLSAAAAAHQPELEQAPFQAARKGRASTAAAMVDNSKALYAAAEAGNTEVVRVLLAAGASIKAAATQDTDPLHAAASAGHCDVVQQLLEACAKVAAADRVDLSTSLYAAAAAGHSGVVQLLLAAGADANPAVTNGSTPLYAAATAGHVKVVECLLHSGADPRLRVGWYTALSEAAVLGDVAVVQLLLDAYKQPAITAAELVRATQLAAGRKYKAAFRRLVTELKTLYPAELRQLSRALYDHTSRSLVAEVFAAWKEDVCSTAQEITMSEARMARDKMAVQQLFLCIASMAQTARQQRLPSSAALAMEDCAAGSHNQCCESALDRHMDT
jgi:ankyrin repeat protein